MLFKSAMPLSIDDALRRFGLTPVPARPARDHRGGAGRTADHRRDADRRRQVAVLPAAGGGAGAAGGGGLAAHRAHEGSGRRAARRAASRPPSSTARSRRRARASGCARRCAASCASCTSRPSGFARPGSSTRWRAAQPALVAIDEAHCIVEWGHDFRPDYARLGEVRAQLGAARLVALTATATPDVRRAIARAARRWTIRRCSCAASIAPNLQLAVRAGAGRRRQAAPRARAARRAAGARGAGDRLRGDAQEGAEVAERAARSAGVRARVYHAGLDDDERADGAGRVHARRACASSSRPTRSAWASTRATCGWSCTTRCRDRPRPTTRRRGAPAATAQPARCVLLFNHADVRLQEFLIASGGADAPPRPAAVVEAERERLRVMMAYAYARGCRRAFLLEYFGDESIAAAATRCRATPARARQRRRADVRRGSPARAQGAVVRGAAQRRLRPQADRAVPGRLGRARGGRRGAAPRDHVRRAARAAGGVGARRARHARGARACSSPRATSIRACASPRRGARSCSTGRACSRRCRPSAPPRRASACAWRPEAAVAAAVAAGERRRRAGRSAAVRAAARAARPAGQGGAAPGVLRVPRSHAGGAGAAAAGDARRAGRRCPASVRPSWRSTARRSSTRCARPTRLTDLVGELGQVVRRGRPCRR